MFLAFKKSDFSLGLQNSCYCVTSEKCDMNQDQFIQELAQRTFAIVPIIHTLWRAKHRGLTMQHRFNLFRFFFSLCSVSMGSLLKLYYILQVTMSCRSELRLLVLMMSLRAATPYLQGVDVLHWAPNTNRSMLDETKFQL